MGIINMVHTIKTVHPEDVVMVSIGSFYYLYGKDAYIISYLFNYELKLIENIYSCAFPKKSLNRVMSLLEDKKVNYIGVDRKNNYEVDFKCDYENLNKYNEIFEKAKRYVLIKRRIYNINNYLNKSINEKNINELLSGVEKVINEKRKL